MQRKLADELFLFIGERFHSNSTVFLDGRRALVVEGTASREDGRALKRFVEEELAAEAILLLSTHYFSDHLAAWSLFPKAAIVAQASYRETFDREAFRSEEERSFFVEPQLLVEERLEVRWGRHRLEVFHNPGHTESTLAVDVPEADLLHVGDTLVGNIVYLQYTTPERMETALRRLKKRGRKRVLSSHRGVSDAGRLDNALYYLDRLREEVTAVGSPAEVADIPLERCLAPGRPATDFERIFHQRNLAAIVERKLFAAGAASS
jgi:glyoxylase-like metal-dependent hydrolase (beta-lactamase superfamily II)